MNDNISENQRLLQEIVEHLSADTNMDVRKAVTKLEQIALATIPALTIQVRH